MMPHTHHGTSSSTPWTADTTSAPLVHSSAPPPPPSAPCPQRPRREGRSGGTTTVLEEETEKSTGGDPSSPTEVDIAAAGPVTADKSSVAFPALCLDDSDESSPPSFATTTAAASPTRHMLSRATQGDGNGAARDKEEGDENVAGGKEKAPFSHPACVKLAPSLSPPPFISTTEAAEASLTALPPSPLGRSRGPTASPSPTFFSSASATPRECASAFDDVTPPSVRLPQLPASPHSASSACPSARHSGSGGLPTWSPASPQASSQPASCISPRRPTSPPVRRRSVCVGGLYLAVPPLRASINSSFDGASSAEGPRGSCDSAAGFGLPQSTFRRPSTVGTVPPAPPSVRSPVSDTGSGRGRGFSVVRAASAVVEPTTANGGSGRGSLDGCNVSGGTAYGTRGPHAALPTVMSSPTFSADHFALSPSDSAAPSMGLTPPPASAAARDLQPSPGILPSPPTLQPRRTQPQLPSEPVAVWQPMPLSQDAAEEADAVRNDDPDDDAPNRCLHSASAASAPAPATQPLAPRAIPVGGDGAEPLHRASLLSPRGPPPPPAATWLTFDKVRYHIQDHFSPATRPLFDETASAGAPEDHPAAAAGSLGDDPRQRVGAVFSSRSNGTDGCGTDAPLALSPGDGVCLSAVQPRRRLLHFRSVVTPPAAPLGCVAGAGDGAVGSGRSSDTEDDGNERRAKHGADDNATATAGATGTGSEHGTSTTGSALGSRSGRSGGATARRFFSVVHTTPTRGRRPPDDGRPMQLPARRTRRASLSASRDKFPDLHWEPLTGFDSRYSILSAASNTDSRASSPRSPDASSPSLETSEVSAPAAAPALQPRAEDASASSGTPSSSANAPSAPSVDVTVSVSHSSPTRHSRSPLRTTSAGSNAAAPTQIGPSASVTLGTVGDSEDRARRRHTLPPPSQPQDADPGACASHEQPQQAYHPLAACWALPHGSGTSASTTLGTASTAALSPPQGALFANPIVTGAAAT